MLKLVRVSLIAAWLMIAAETAAGDAAPPQPQPQAQAQPAAEAQPADPKPSAPKPPEVKVPPLEVPNFSQQDWDRFLFDFQAGDAEKQKAAIKAFIDSGARGFNEMQKFINSANADIAAQAKQVQTEINKESWERYTQCAALKSKVDNEPFTVEALQKLQQAWMATAMYSSQNALRQSGYQMATAIHKQIQVVDAAQRNLVQHDETLKTLPETNKLARAGVHLDRGHAFKDLNRVDDVIAAGNRALEDGGPEWRLKPAALKLLIEAHEAKQDPKTAGTYAWRIIREHPKSLEVKFAFENILETLLVDGKWSEAVEHLKAFHAAFPLDSDVNERILGTLSALMDDHHEYKHVAALSEWIMNTLPPERWSLDAPKLAGGTAEYVLQDYAKADKYYRILSSHFSDLIDPKSVEPVLTRVKLKAEGKFPKEPSETDEGPAGAVAKFLKAIRANDRKAAAAAVIEDDAENYSEGDSLDLLIPGLTFADYIVRKVDVDEAAGRAVITMDYYDASTATPQQVKQDAVREDGVWKMEWIEGDGATMELQPADAAPAAPAPAPAGK